ncbi:hypothetical protein BGZ57DRAFT_77419 [Hyaloscypha finlandica]|nr:hypothetical protein BGZ57DRAFT_77419 [Hyaloscypha finlandica]
MRGPQRVRCLQERRCADVRDGVREGQREGGREGGREGERKKGRKGERGRGGGEGEKRTAEEQEHRKNIVGGQWSQRFVTALLIIIGREEGVLRTAPCGWPAPLQRPAFGVAGRLSWLSWLAWLALCTEQKGFMISNPAGHLSWGHNRDLDLPVCASRACSGWVPMPLRGTSAMPFFVSATMGKYLPSFVYLRTLRFAGEERHRTCTQLTAAL